MISVSGKRVKIVLKKHLGGEMVAESMREKLKNFFT